MTKNTGYTFDLIKDVASRYQSKTAFHKEQRKLYCHAYRKGWWTEVSAHMDARTYPVKWTEEKVREAAATVGVKKDFAKMYPGAYAAARDIGILLQVCSHMKRRMLPEELRIGRKCKVCGVFKTRVEMASSKNVRSGLSASCKACESLRSVQYSRDNLIWKRAATALARGRRRKATPSWLAETDIQRMVEKYKFAASETVRTGVPHEVDHEVPIAGKYVCGLHVPWNLRIIPMEANRSKMNSYPYWWLS